MTNIWPIGGGKGGTGKSFLTGNLGILLARQRFKTLLVDADLGAANLHTIIGLPHPDRSLSDFLNKRLLRLEDAVLETPIPNLFLISGASNRLDIANLAYEQKMKMFRAISKLDYHYILLDLSAGTSFNTIDFFTLSDSGIFVCCPEPTSIENFYRLIRSVYIRTIHQILKTHQFRKLADEAEARKPNAIVSNPECLLNALKEIDLEKGSLIERILQAFQFKLVLNQIRKQDNAKIGSLICKIIEKHLGLKIQFMGNVAFDERVHDELCKKGPFVEKYPYSQTTIDLKSLTKSIAGVPHGQGELPAFTLSGVNTLTG
jgi:flagellar biosynthesis protein FlhG